MHPKTRYKLCKIRENRARDTPLRGFYIPHFDQISVRILVLGVLYAPIVAPMRVKFGVEEETKDRSPPPRQISPHRCNVSPLRGEKPQNQPLSSE